MFHGLFAVEVAESVPCSPGGQQPGARSSNVLWKSVPRCPHLLQVSLFLQSAVDEY